MLCAFKIRIQVDQALNLTRCGHRFHNIAFFENNKLYGGFSKVTFITRILIWTRPAACYFAYLYKKIWSRGADATMACVGSSIRFRDWRRWITFCWRGRTLCAAQAAWPVLPPRAPSIADASLQCHKQTLSRMRANFLYVDFWLLIKRVGYHATMHEMN